jgi:sugar phosphate isomerase/epimerase
MSARMRRAFAAALCLAAFAAAPASAAQPDCTGRGVPVNKISIQEYTFAEYIGFGTDAATQARLEQVLAFLRDTGYRNIELFTLSGLSATQMRALLDEYGIKASARHVDVGTPTAPANLDRILAENKILGIKYFGSGATPNYATEAQWVAYAEYLDALGERARKAGQTLMVHNHNWEFERQFADVSAYETLLAHTDPRNVVFQLDLYWSTRGLGTAEGATNVAQADDLSAELVRRLGNRAQLFHVKDMATGAFPGRIEIVGAGGIDFPSIFAASKGPVRYYVVEHDPRFNPAQPFDPFEAARAGFDYLTCVRY